MIYFVIKVILDVMLCVCVMDLWSVMPFRSTWAFKMFYWISCCCIFGAFYIYGVIYFWNYVLWGYTRQKILSPINVGLSVLLNINVSLQFFRSSHLLHWRRFNSAMWFQHFAIDVWAVITNTRINKSISSAPLLISYLSQLYLLKK